MGLCGMGRCERTRIWFEDIMDGEWEREAVYLICYEVVTPMYLT